LNPTLESLDALSSRYGDCPTYSSLFDLLSDPDVGPQVDGVIVCTPHSTHFEIGRMLIDEGRRRYEEGAGEGDGDGDDDDAHRRCRRHRPMNVLMEKPMTTDVDEARELHDLLADRRRAGGGGGTDGRTTTIGGGWDASSSITARITVPRPRRLGR
jgi:predicted dehydrogenase